ncbi:uridine kinase [Streptomyces sp. NPDC020794]|uniref:uridine kinase family protein n=1 Tax=unclassified Streptomyces TaxID=2593676 RepID=UPI0036F09D76
MSSLEERPGGSEMGSGEAVILCIGGAAGSGKTTVARSLLESAPGATLLMLDKFYFEDPSLAPTVTDRRSGRGIVDKGDPRSICWQKVSEEIGQVKWRAKLVIVEGIFSLTPLMPDLGQTRVYLDTPVDVSLARKILRKVRDQNEPAEQVVLNYLERGRDTFLQHIQPTASRADLVLDGTLPCKFLVGEILSCLTTTSNNQSASEGKFSK